MKVFVTGATGQVGSSCILELKSRGMDVRGVSSKDFSITDTEALRKALLDYQPDVIIHCAAYTAVDKAEDEPELCREVNADATAEIARISAELHAKLVYLSTDYVFPGTGTASFEVGSETGPLNVYGRTKLLGELAVREYVLEHFIVRISWVFGPGGKNFIRTMMKLSETHEEVRVVDDQVGSPTYARDVAVLLAHMITTDRYGTYHATNEGFCSWAELAKEVFRQAGRSTKVIPVLSSEYPTKARRPRNSRLNKSSLDRGGFPRLPRWKDAVGRYLIELAKEE